MTTAQKIAVLDTETSGLPLYKERSTDPAQPHLVELAVKLFASDGTELERFAAIIKPDGWLIPDDVAAIHGITQERAMDEGIPEAEAIEAFLALHNQSQLRVAHNVSFDDRIMRIALLRYLGEADADAYKAHPTFCTANESRPILKLPPSEAQKAKTSFKTRTPTLAEAFAFFTGEPLQEAHRAEPDADACARIYFAMAALREGAELIADHQAREAAKA